MAILEDHGVQGVSHYTPLHYLPFISRAKVLMGKPSLKAAGFGPDHLRSMSSKQDVMRGFGEYGFLTLDKHPRILSAKLKAGFPHIGLWVPAEAFKEVDFALSRYNVAMTRRLRRAGKTGFIESSSNGRYYGAKQIPVARTADDKAAMLAKYVDSNTMIEVLVKGDLPLPEGTTVVCYSSEDQRLAQTVINSIGTPWKVVLEAPPGEYNRKETYAKSVAEFIHRAITDPDWRGDGLEFDRV